MEALNLGGGPCRTEKYRTSLHDVPRALYFRFVMNGVDAQGGILEHFGYPSRSGRSAADRDVRFYPDVLGGCIASTSA